MDLNEHRRSMRVLVTGANGFVGSELCRQLAAAGCDCVRAVRKPGAGDVPVGDIGPDTDWRAALAGVEVVVHLASRVHVMNERHDAAEAAFHHINVLGTAALARQAQEAGVKRMVYVSSIKASGEITHGRPMLPDDPPQPEDAYGRSKLAAENVLRELCGASGMELVIVRPPMVVGPGVRGNLPVLMKAIQRGLPLPLACVRNRRSLVSVRNLAALLVACARQPEAAGQTYLAAEPEPVSTPELVHHLAAGLGRPARLLPVPVMLLKMAGRLTGRQDQIARLCSDLELDASRASALPGWMPVESLAEALQDSARAFLAKEQRA